MASRQSAKSQHVSKNCDFRANSPPQNEEQLELVELLARVYREALVIEVEVDSEYTKISGWMGKANLARLTKDHPEQIQISS